MKYLQLLTIWLIFSNSAYSQCNIHLYQCTFCGQNSQGTNSPLNGNYCSGRDNTNLGHYWKNQGLTPECEKQQNDARATLQKQRDAVLSECEKYKVKTFKGTKVINWYCPSGKPYQIQYTNGITEQYTEDGIIEKRFTPKGNNSFVENFENGKLISKGILNEYSAQDGEWYYTQFYRNYYSENNGKPYECSNCTVVYSNGNFLGVGTLKQVEEQQKKIEIEKQSNLIKEDFDRAMSAYIYGNTYYGNVSLLKEFVLKYPNSEFIAQAKEAINNKDDNDFFYYAKTLNDYQDYQKEFPNGIHSDEVETAIKNTVVSNIDAFSKSILKELESGNAGRTIELCELVLKYQDDISTSYRQVITTYYSLALWATNNQAKAIEVIKSYSNSIIQFSNQNKKFMDNYLTCYDLYKGILKIDSDKETYKAIKKMQNS